SARYHEEPPCASDPCDHLVREAVCEHAMRVLVACKPKRQHCDRRLARQRELEPVESITLCRNRLDVAARRACMVAAWLDDDADEPVALAVHGSDQDLVLAVVADVGAHGLDATVDRGVRDDAAAPHAVIELAASDDPVAIRDEIREEL